MKLYSIYRHFQSKPPELIKEGLTLEEAKEHCNDPETSSRTCTTPEGHARTRVHGAWFDGFEEE